MDVYANERKWQIHVFFDTPLDFETYRSLNELIHQTFEPFVNVELLVRPRMEIVKIYLNTGHMQFKIQLI